jgi:hypothetical protein
MGMKKQLLTVYNYETKSNQLVYADDCRSIDGGIVVTNTDGSAVTVQIQEAAEIVLESRETLNSPA